jgi:5-methylthioadenosine/S-adenosylhomocysteine deaminase
VSLLVRDAILDGEVRSLRIEDGKIAALSESGEGTADRVIEAAGLHAFPSLKNGHTHAAMTLFRGYGDDMPLMDWLKERIWPAEALLTEEDVYHGTRLALLEMIQSGTTYLSDMYWHRDGVARAVRDMGVTAHVASVFIDLGDPEKAKEQQDRVHERYAERNKFGPRVKMALGPHAIYTVSPGSLEFIAEFARENDLIVHIHLSETEGEVNDCVAAHGLRPVELLDRVGLLGPNLVAAHGIWLSDRERELLGGAGASIVTNPVSNLKLAVGGIFDYDAAKAAGIRVAIGTDGAASNNNLNLLEDVKIAALVQKHRAGDPTTLPAAEALDLATKGTAAAYGLGPGTLAVGAPADIMLVDLSGASTRPVHDPVSSLVYAAGPECVVTTIAGGEVLMHGRELEIADETEILENAEKAARDLVLRAAAGGHP